MQPMRGVLVSMSVTSAPQLSTHIWGVLGGWECVGGVRVPELVSLPLASPLGFTLPRGKGRFFLLGNLSPVRCSFSHVTLPLKQSQLPC